MRSVVITRHGPPEVLQVQERPDPKPGPGEVEIEVRAAGINFADLMARVGLYPDAPNPPTVVGYEVAGTVSAVGEGANGHSVGDRVMAGTRFGGYSERVVARAANVAALPESLSFEQGAAVPVNYLTAHLALVRFGSLEKGERVLIHAAAGGVGIAATQIAKAGAQRCTGRPRPRSTTRSAGSAWTTRSTTPLGLGEGRAAAGHRDGRHRGTELPSQLPHASGRRPAGLLRRVGRDVGGQAKPPDCRPCRAAHAAFNLIKQMSESKSIIGLNMLTLWDELESLEPYMGAIEQMVADGTARPVVAQSFRFDRAPEAHRFLGERRNVGKVVLTP